MNGCFVSEPGLYARDWCAQMIARFQASEAGAEGAGMFAGVGKRGTIYTTRAKGGGAEGAVRRVVERLTLEDGGLAAELLATARAVLPATWVVPPPSEDPHAGPFSEGTWALHSAGSSVQLYRYGPGGCFGEHRDGALHCTPDRRSLFTVLVYLNDGCAGGATVVHSDDRALQLRVEPACGRAFAMLQRMLHEGAAVEGGEKYALRFDAVYERVDPSLAALAARLPRPQAAREWHRLAAALEDSKAYAESVECYMRAEKLGYVEEEE